VSDNDIRRAARPASRSKANAGLTSLIGWRLEWWSAVRCTARSGGIGEACQALQSVEVVAGLESRHEEIRVEGERVAGESRRLS
jgi:hypothetical protein